ncbi:MAG: response regulator [Gammaproteobacteria bacterium]|nr:response regulator [Gammaproteobacteria bacterium]
MKILLVEDDPLIGHGIRTALTDANHNLEWIKDGAQAIAAIQSADYDAILLDLGLPNVDGTEVLRQLRQARHSESVIIITARDGLDDRIKGLDLGADDYLVKPFAISELQARLRAVARRKTDTASPALQTSALKLDPNTGMVEVHGEAVQLSAREFALLEALMRRAGQVFNREQLESKVYSIDDDIASNAIEVLIHALRKKLGKEAIKNIRGLGWMVPN